MRRFFGVLCITILLCLIGCAITKPQFKEKGNELVIDSLRYSYDQCFSTCPKNNIIINRNGKITVRSDSSEIKGNIPYYLNGALQFTFNYVVQTKIYLWKCQYSMIVDGNFIGYDIYTKDTVYKISSGPCSNYSENLVVVSLLLDYLYTNTIWEDSIPPLQYEIPNDQYMFKNLIEKKTLNLEKEIRQLKEIVESKKKR